MVKRYSVLAIILLFVLQSIGNAAPVLESETIPFDAGRASGVDISVSDVDFSYANFADEQKYQMFSSNHPISNFNRPASLFVIDAVIDVPIRLEVTVDNLGTSNSQNVDLRLLIIHNEYTDFELHNESTAIGTINAQSSVTGKFVLTPLYSGNHTLIITPSTTTIDDNGANDELQSTFTVASHYYNCDDLTSWTVGNTWNSNSDTYLSQNGACHYGNGQSSSYLANQNSDLITPVMDMSDAIANPMRTNGISFYYTGSLASGDYVKIYMNDNGNAWTELASMTGTIDSTFTDGANWQTWSVNNAGAFSPLIPVPQQNFDANTQFKFSFSSDSAVNDIGLWMDDIVIVYDQKVKQMEYGVSSSGVFVDGAVPESWGKARILLTNTGNISETFKPSITGLPSGWQYYFSYTSGVSISEANGILLEKGETKEIDLHYQPKAGENQGLYQVDFVATSNLYQSTKTTLNLQFEVVPDRIPEVIDQVTVPTCAPGSTCLTTVYVSNIGGAADVFDISILYGTLPTGWSVSLAWDQESAIFVQPGTSIPVRLTFTIPEGAVPDTIGEFQLKATSENDTSRMDQKTIQISASMVSNAEIIIAPNQMGEVWELNPGDSKTVYFEVTNKASVQDIFDTSIVIIGTGDWLVSDVIPSTLYINSDKTATFSATITAPTTAQVGDECPEIIGKIISQRSVDEYQSESVDNLEIKQVNDLKLIMTGHPSKIRPGEENNFTFELTNLGNGGLQAQLEPIGLPSDWTWTILADGIVTENQIQLGDISELDSQKDIIVSINVPPGIEHGTLFEFTFVVEPYMSSIDTNPEDNTEVVSIETELVRKLAINSNAETLYSGTGNTSTITTTVQNLGNVKESGVLVRAQVNYGSYELPTTSFFFIGNTGIPYDFNIYHKITIDKGSSRDLSVDINIPEDFDIGNEIEVLFEIQYTDGEVLTISKNLTIIVDYTRQTIVDIGTKSIPVIAGGGFGDLWVNITTKSTIDENYLLQFDSPNGWEIMCQSEVVNETGFLIEQPIKNDIQRSSSSYCEIINSGTIYEGTVALKLLNQDGSILFTGSETYTFEKKISDSASLSTNEIGGIIGLILAVIVTSLIIMIRLKKNDVEENFEKPKKGPPISGPPITTAVENSPTLEYDTGISPQIPEDGLPQGWSIEQWKHYGQQYLDRTRGK